MTHRTANLAFGAPTLPTPAADKRPAAVQTAATATSRPCPTPGGRGYNVSMVQTPAMVRVRAVALAEMRTLSWEMPADCEAAAPK
jgi:hypothetical protein